MSLISACVLLLRILGFEYRLVIDLGALLRDSRSYMIDYRATLEWA